MQEHPIIEKRITRPGVKGDKVALKSDIGDICNAANVDECHRAFTQFERQRLMINGCHGRTLPTCANVSGAHIINNCYSGQPRKTRAIAQLHRQPCLRRVVDGVTVEADDVDFRAIKLNVLKKLGYSLCMEVRQVLFGNLQNTWSGVPVPQIFGQCDGLCKTPPEGIRIRKRKRGPAP